MTGVDVQPFFHEPSGTFTYLAIDPATKAAAIIDPVLDYDPVSGSLGIEAVQALVDVIRKQGLELQWILETHVHADHLTAAWVLKELFHVPVGIGDGVRAVQERFGWVLDEDGDAGGGDCFDCLFRDGEELALGALPVRVIATPGHTPSCVTYLIGDAAFVGDTLFMPDVGTARCDFPGGSPSTLYISAQRILSLPDHVRLYSAHDYKTAARETPGCGATVAEQKRDNLHVGGGTGEDMFVAFRAARDASLPLPRLFYPSLQVNITGGRLPAPSPDGTRCLKIPLTPSPALAAMLEGALKAA